MPTIFDNHKHRRGSYLSHEELCAKATDVLHGFRSIRFISDKAQMEEKRTIFSASCSSPALTADESRRWRDDGGEG